MSSKIYKVFISSTLKDLTDERREVIDGLLSNQCMPVSMEFFPGSSERPLTLIERLMTDCDYFVVVVAGKYGSLHEETGLSFTEMEYDIALKLHIPTLVFPHRNPDELRAKDVERDPEMVKKLDSFRHRINIHTTKDWFTATELRAVVMSSLGDSIISSPREGFVKTALGNASAALTTESVRTFHQIERQNKKTGYIRFLHLHRQFNGAGPIYGRYIDRLDQIVPVFDEYVLFRVNDFPEIISEFECRDSSTGVVDLSILNPWQPRLIIPERVYEQTPGEIQQIVQGESSTFTTVTHYFNAFQKNQYLLIRMEKDTDEARLIVDFRYLPGHADIINAKAIKATLKANVGGLEKHLQVYNRFKENRKFVTIPGMFWVNGENLKKGDTIGIDFKKAINWEATETVPL